MADDEGRLESLTIYLAREGLREPLDLIETLGALHRHDLSAEVGVPAVLYVQTRTTKPPKWGRFFVPPLKLTDLGRVSSTAALLHIVVDERAFLIAFGQGRHLLKTGCYEERFGLKVTLNSIAADHVRSIDKQTLDTLGRHTRVQASKEATASEFGLDIEQDLLRAITGTPDDTTLGKTLSGLDALHVIARVRLESLADLLARYLVQFGKETYKQTFPWIDHIAEVKDAIRKERLDGLMLSTVASATFDKCWLAVPEPIEWARVSGFRYGEGSKHATLHDIHFATFLSDSNIDPATLTVELLRQRRVTAVDGDGTPAYSWTAYRCIYCEVEDRSDTFILSDGRWYKVASDFVGPVNDFYRRMPFYGVELPIYNDASETGYNKRVAAESSGAYALMDQQLISVGGGYSKVEFCDLLSRDNDLIHVKRYGGSGLLSHLFAQGVVSGQLFVSDANFRTAANDLLPSSHKLPDPQVRPDATAYRIVYAIVSHETGKTLTLPFFSKLNVRHAAQRLEGYGYKVELAKIAIDDTVAKTKKLPSRGRKR